MIDENGHKIATHVTLDEHHSAAQLKTHPMGHESFIRFWLESNVRPSDYKFEKGLQSGSLRFECDPKLSEKRNIFFMFPKIFFMCAVS